MFFVYGPAMSAFAFQSELFNLPSRNLISNLKFFFAVSFSIRVSNPASGCQWHVRISYAFEVSTCSFQLLCSSFRHLLLKSCGLSQHQPFVLVVSQVGTVGFQLVLSFTLFVLISFSPIMGTLLLHPSSCSQLWLPSSFLSLIFSSMRSHLQCRQVFPSLVLQTFTSPLSYFYLLRSSQLPFSIQPWCGHS